MNRWNNSVILSSLFLLLFNLGDAQKGVSVVEMDDLLDRAEYFHHNLLLSSEGEAILQEIATPMDLDSVQLFRIYRLKGLIAKRLEYYVDAARYLRNAQQYLTEPSSKAGLELKGDIAYIDKLLDESRELIKYLYSGLDNLSDRTIPRLRAAFPAQLGRTYVMLNELDSATHYFDLADKEIVHVQGDQVRMQILKGRGDIAHKRRDYALAATFYEQGLRAALDHGAPIFIANTALAYSRNHEAMGHIDEALVQADLSLKYARIAHAGYNIWQAMYQQYLLFRVMGDKDAAARLLPILKGMGDLRDDTNAERMEKAQKASNIELQNTEISLLELQDSMKQNQLVRARWMVGVLVGGLLLLSILLFKIRNQNRIITSQNEVISKALREKDFLLKEVHHRVKNNLQVISSLLKLQSKSVVDKKAQRALDEGRHRVRSMSLIHQNLYQDEDHLGLINVKTYLEQLTSELLESYKTDQGSIQLEVDIDELTLDVETVIPIGLIINELVSNSLKYAFPPDTEGSITIQLKEDEQDGLALVVSDNGVGYQMDDISPKSFGHRLVRAYAERLNAEYEFSGTDGAKSSFLIKSYNRAA